MKLGQGLKSDLDWLASNWERKQLVNISPYNAEFYAALRNFLSDCASQHDLALIIEGTLGKAADGYAHMLDVEPQDIASDPWFVFRRLGDISERLRELSAT